MTLGLGMTGDEFRVTTIGRFKIDCKIFPVNVTIKKNFETLALIEMEVC